MFYEIVIAVGGMILLVSLYVLFQELANRMRAVNGQCRMNSLRCLGCMASGRCRQESSESKRPRRSRAGNPVEGNPPSAQGGRRAP